MVLIIKNVRVHYSIPTFSIYNKLKLQKQTKCKDYTMKIGKTRQIFARPKHELALRPLNPDPIHYNTDINLSRLWQMHERDNKQKWLIFLTIAIAVYVF